MAKSTYLNSRGAFALALVLCAAPVAAQFSSPIRDVENPARTPLQATGTINISVGFAGVLNSPLVTIPAGQRMVIEQVSVRCSSPAGNNIVRANIGVTQLMGGGSTTRSFEIPINFQGTDPFAGPTYVGGISSRVYSDPGFNGSAGITGGVIRENGTGTGVCSFAISGYTITV